MDCFLNVPNWQLLPFLIMLWYQQHMGRYPPVWGYDCLTPLLSSQQKSSEWLEKWTLATSKRNGIVALASFRLVSTHAVCWLSEGLNRWTEAGEG